jgi:PBP superfamily domain
MGRITWILVLDLFFIGLVLAGCQSPQVAPPPPTLAVVQVQITPALEPWRARLHACAATLPGAGLLVDEAAAAGLDPARVDLSLRFGPPDPLVNFAVVVGSEDITLLVNPQNPLKDLSLKSLADIYTGRVTRWVNLPGGEQAAGLQDLPIQAWTYYPVDDLRQVFDRAVLAGEPSSDSPPKNIHAAPAIAAMLEAISADPGAVGYTIGGQFDSQVRTLPLSGVATGLTGVSVLTGVPVLALSSIEPQGLPRQLVLCLQK